MFRTVYLLEKSIHFLHRLLEGVVLVDPEYVKGRKVYIHLLCAFRHGRDGDEFHGINWHRDLFLNTKQVYPSLALPDENSHPKISRLQERLVRKLGPDSYPFTFKVPCVLIYHLVFFFHMHCFVLQFCVVFCKLAQRESVYCASSLVLSSLLHEEYCFLREKKEKWG